MFTFDVANAMAQLQARLEARVARICAGCRAAAINQVVASQGLALSLAPRITGALHRGIVVDQESVTANGATCSVKATAAHTRPVAEGAAPHVILPKRGRFLRFQGRSGTVFARRVDHPGNAANLFWWRTIIETKRDFRQRVQSAVHAALS